MLKFHKIKDKKKDEKKMLTQGNVDDKSFQGKRHSHYQLKMQMKTTLRCNYMHIISKTKQTISKKAEMG